MPDTRRPRPTSRQHVAVVVALLSGTVLVLAACGDDSGGGGSGEQELASGDGYSVAAALAELPADLRSDGATITTADLEAACEANGCTVPDDASDEDAAREWQSLMTGGAATGDQPPVVVSLPESIAPVSASLTEFTDEIGWSALDVSSFAGVQAPPERFTVVTGDGIGDALSNDLVEVADGVVSTSDAEDLHQDLMNRSSADELGRPVRFAADGDRLAVSVTTPELETWLDGPDETLADDESLAGVAAALDTAGVVSAVIDAGGGPYDLDTSMPADLPQDQRAAAADRLTLLPAAFDAVGIGWSADEGESLVTIAYHHESAEAATENADAMETLFTEGTDSRSFGPLSERYEFVEAAAEDTVATVTIAPSHPAHILDALYQRDIPFIHS